MNKLLKCLYDCFYNPPEFSEQKQEVEECHQALIQVLEKPERRLVPRPLCAETDRRYPRHRHPADPSSAQGER